jgi:two-component system cell cycle sensor histidine kinase/response regulator CckA
MSTLHIPPEHLRVILEAIPDGIGVERKGKIVWANRGFARLYGYEHPGELLGRSLEAFVVPEDLPRLQEYSDRRIRGVPVPDHYQFRGLHRSGQIIEVEIFVSSYVHDGFLHVLGALRDITERVALARRMEQSQKLEALGTLTRGIAHDFNNLLTAVMGNIAVARERIAHGQDPHKALHRAAVAAERGAQLTRQLQAFTGRPQPEIQASDPSGLVQDTVDLLEHTITPALRIKLELQGELPSVLIPPDQLQQILMNLALNAVDAMKGRGNLTLRASFVPPEAARPFMGAKPIGYLRFEVRDDGPGIPPTVLPRIFEPFFTTKPPGEGTGLGLAVVFGTVNSHGGHVEVRSRPGRGTRFVIWLPAAPPTASGPGAHPERSRQPRSGGRTVLVVDDDDHVRTLFQEVLEMGGYTPLMADSGEAAVQLLTDRAARGEPLDLAVVDLVMPGMDGISCIEQLHGMQPTLPVLLCTGLDRDGRLEQLPPSSRIEVLRKPVSLERLLREVGARLQGE